MRIYTSYLALVRKMPDSIVPVRICNKPPFPWNGLSYIKLAPKKGFFMEWKRNGDNDFYVRHFNDEVLSLLTPEQVRKEIAELVNDKTKDVALCCLERPGQFCHRHLVAKWLGDDVTELSL